MRGLFGLLIAGLFVAACGTTAIESDVAAEAPTPALPVATATQPFEPPPLVSAAGSFADVASCSGIVTRVEKLNSQGTDDVDVDLVRIDVDTRIRELDCDRALLQDALLALDSVQDGYMAMLRNAALKIQAAAIGLGGYYPSPEYLTSNTTVPEIFGEIPFS